MCVGSVSSLNIQRICAYMFCEMNTFMHTHKHIRIHTEKKKYIYQLTRTRSCPVGWGCRIHRLLLCRGVRLPTPKRVSLIYETKQSDGEVPVIVGIWGMRSTPLLLSFPGPLWPGVVATDRVLSTSKIELNCVLMLN